MHLKKEAEINKRYLEASLIRDRKAREMALNKKKTFNNRIIAREGNMYYVDLAWKQKMIIATKNDTSRLYEQVKLERNRHINTVQISR